jgi:hypothetical protein
VVQRVGSHVDLLQLDSIGARTHVSEARDGHPA